MTVSSLKPWVPPAREDEPQVEQVTQREAAARRAEIAFKREAVDRLKRRNPGDALLLLDGLERFFDDGEFWIRKNDGAHGNRCLVGGIEEARRAYSLSDSRPAHFYLGEAINPHDGYTNLPEWNAKCKDFATLRGVIDKARRLAQADEKRLRDAEVALPVEEAVQRRGWWRG
jgi:hypothetical protein